MSDYSKFQMVDTYRHDNFAQIVNMLRRALPCEPISEANFARKVILDPNFDPMGAFVARTASGGVNGFLLALARRRPLEDAPSDAERGWITLFAVEERNRGRGVGTALLAAAENWLCVQGRREVWISPYAPNYWTPGVDEAAYAEGLHFLHRRGYTTAYRPLSMQASLVGWRPPAHLYQSELLRQHSILPRIFTPADAGRLMEFLRDEFPGDWQRYLREAMLDIAAERRSCEDLFLLVHEERVIGFAHSEGERFGPFGMAKEWRGKGLGTLLLTYSLDSMRRRGLHNAWFLWTDDATAERLYKPAGFRETRRYTVLRKMLK